jgi:hypothetical protein
MQPKDHMSIAVEYSFAPKSNSGALQLKEHMMRHDCTSEKLQSDLIYN